MITLFLNLLADISTSINGYAKMCSVFIVKREGIVTATISDATSKPNFGSIYSG